VYLKDKGNTGYSIDRPKNFSPREALERRAQRKVAVNKFGYSNFRIIHRQPFFYRSRTCGSKQMDVYGGYEFSDSLVVDKLKALSFVDSVKWVWKGEADYPKNLGTGYSKFYPSDLPVANYYGAG
jgi:hypothetical protein